MSFTSIILLELEHGKFFVTAGGDPEKVVDEYREGLGPVWTKIHRPVRIREVIQMAVPTELDQHVRRWMLHYGVENVRGGSWSDVRLTDKDRQVLCGELTQQRGCVVC